MFFRFLLYHRFCFLFVWQRYENNLEMANVGGDRSLRLSKGTVVSGVSRASTTETTKKVINKTAYLLTILYKK